MTNPFLPMAKIVIAHSHWALKKHWTKYFSCIISLNSHNNQLKLLILLAFTGEETKPWTCSKVTQLTGMCMRHLSSMAFCCHNSCCLYSLSPSLSLFIKMMLILQGCSHLRLPGWRQNRLLFPLYLYTNSLEWLFSLISNIALYYIVTCHLILGIHPENVSLSNYVLEQIA